MINEFIESSQQDVGSMSIRLSPYFDATKYACTVLYNSVGWFHSFELTQRGLLYSR
jgi:hypothetical protein